jgi:hypothetical protein
VYVPVCREIVQFTHGFNRKKYKSVVDGKDKKGFLMDQLFFLYGQFFYGHLLYDHFLYGHFLYSMKKCMFTS